MYRYTHVVTYTFGTPVGAGDEADVFRRLIKHVADDVDERMDGSADEWTDEWTDDWTDDWTG